MQIRLPNTRMHTYHLSSQMGNFLTFISMLLQERCWCLPFARREGTGMMGTLLGGQTAPHSLCSSLWAPAWQQLQQIWFVSPWLSTCQLSLAHILQASPSRWVLRSTRLYPAGETSWETGLWRSCKDRAGPSLYFVSPWFDSNRPLAAPAGCVTWSQVGSSQLALPWHSSGHRSRIREVCSTAPLIIIGQTPMRKRHILIRLFVEVALGVSFQERKALSRGQHSASTSCICLWWLIPPITEGIY